MGELMAGDHNGVIHACGAHAALHVLPKELRGAHGHSVALIAVGVRYDARGRRRVLVVACARGGHLRVTPRSAQQRGVWRHGQSQHNRKDKCSEHVGSAPIDSKKDAMTPGSPSPEQTSFPAISIR